MGVGAGVVGAGVPPLPMTTSVSTVWLSSVALTCAVPGEAAAWKVVVALPPLVFLVAGAETVPRSAWKTTPMPSGMKPTPEVSVATESW